jgi:hypothetical protein
MFIGHIDDDFFNSNRYTNKNYSDKNLGFLDSPESKSQDMNYENNRQCIIDYYLYSRIADKLLEAEIKQQNTREGKKKGFVNNLLNMFK